MPRSTYALAQGPNKRIAFCPWCLGPSSLLPCFVSTTRPHLMLVAIIGDKRPNLRVRAHGKSVVSTLFWGEYRPDQDLKKADDDQHKAALIVLPPGKWLTGSFSLTSYFTLFLHKDAVILASERHHRSRQRRNVGRNPRRENRRHHRAIDTESAARIKTAPGRGAYVKDVFVRRMNLKTMIKYVLWMTGNYKARLDGCDPNAMPVIKSMSYRDVVAENVTRPARLEGRISGDEPFKRICIYRT
ncbi:Pectin lyase fold containing protein [Trema orientale]|uniref:Pectin lyase fold containing protein n=1 Tax=Trema orientale TaxID=63057 RepID=A0A2P5FGR3_TREOI|nr:Pectin lyase fold containing protein [Trema orientale]